MSNQNLIDIYYNLQKIFVLLDDGDRRILRKFDLTPTQYNLIRNLGTDIETGLTITELADVLLCTRGNTTRLVKRLQQQKLIQIGKDANDQRLVRVALTPLGEEKLAAARQAHRDSIQERIGDLELPTQQALAAFTQLLTELLETNLVEQDD